MRCLHILPGGFPSYSQIVRVLFLLENSVDLSNEHRFLFLSSRNRIITSAQHALALRNSLFLDFDNHLSDDSDQLDLEVQGVDRIIVYSYCSKTKRILERLACKKDTIKKVDLVCMPGEFFRYVNFDFEPSEIRPSFPDLHLVIGTGFLEKDLSFDLDRSVYLPRLYSEDSPVYHLSDAKKTCSDRFNLQIGHTVSSDSHLDLIRSSRDWLLSMNAHVYLALNYGWYFKRVSKAESDYLWKTRNAVEDIGLPVTVLSRKCETSTYLRYLNSLSGVLLDVDYPAGEEALMFCLARSVPVLFKRDSLWAWYFDRRCDDLLHIEDLDRRVSRKQFCASAIDDWVFNAIVPGSYSETVDQWLSFLRF